MSTTDHFVTAKILYDADREPCHRYGGCPHNSSIPKNTYKWFCDWCMEELASYGRLYRKRTLAEVEAAIRSSELQADSYPEDKARIFWGSEQ